MHFDRTRYDLFSFVVMNDHVHVVVRPFVQYPLEKLLHSWKSYTASQMQKTGSRVGQVWQDEYFDRIVRDEDELREKVEYIFNNPWKRWPEIDKYEWLYVNLEPLGW